MRRPGFDFEPAARHPNRKTGTRASGVPAGTARPLNCHDPGTRRTGNLESGRLLRAGGLKVKGGSRVGIAAVSATSGRNTATLAPSCARMAGGQRSRGPAWVWPARAERWRKPAIVAVSVLGHVALFSYLGLRSMGLTLSGLVADPDPVIYVEITPRPLLPGEVARVRAVPEPPQVTKAPALPGSPTADPDRPFRNPDDEDSPAPPAPRIGAPAPGAPAPPPGVEGWAVRPETMGDRVGRGLRTRGPGCTSPGLLSAAERAICDDRFGQRAAAAAPIDDTAGSPFAAEGARRLADYDRRRRPLAGGTGNVGPQDGPGSNFGIGVAGAHLDPSLRPDSTENIRTYRREGPR